MPKLASRIGRAAKHAAEQVELHVLAIEGRRSIKSKVGKVKKLAKNAMKAGVIAGAVAATSSLLRAKKRRRTLFA
jgi:hypothetical protein